MRFKPHMRIAAVTAAIILVLSGSVCYYQYNVSASVPDGAGLGFSGEFPESPDDPDQNQSGGAGEPDKPDVETPDPTAPTMETSHFDPPAPEEEDTEEEDPVAEAAPMSSGTLELVSAPASLDYGISILPTTTTLYNRAFCDNVTPDGKMLIEVVDARGSDSTDWILCLQMGALNDRQPFPDGALVFLDGANKHPLTYGSSAAIYSGPRNTTHTDYTLSWGDDQGLLAEIVPGTTQAGVYSSILNWSLQAVP